MTQSYSYGDGNQIDLRIPKTAELAATYIRRQIVKGELAEGDSLPSESALMAQFNISRPTLREAFRILESEALISVRRGAHGGGRVHVPNGDVAARYAALVLQYRGATVADVYEARTILEPPAAGMIAQRRDRAKAVKTLEAKVEEAREALEISVDNFIEIHHGFHQLLVELAGNETLLVLSGMLEHITNSVGHLFLEIQGEAPTRQQSRKAVKAHSRVIEIIASGDANGAEEYWRRHLVESGAAQADSSSQMVVDLLN